MTEVISTSFYDRFIDLCANSRKSIRLCAPFVKSDVVGEVISAKQPNVTVNLITKVSLKNFHNKASDVSALDEVLTNGGAVYNCSNLHAKVYIFDENKCIITSANITTSGLKRNVECGILSGDVTIVTDIINLYENICKRTDVGRISKEILFEINALLKGLSTTPEIIYPRLNIQYEEQWVSDENLLSIADSLVGWKRDVFLSLSQFSEEFTTSEISKSQNSYTNVTQIITIGKLKSAKFCNNYVI